MPLNIIMAGGVGERKVGVNDIAQQCWRHGFRLRGINGYVLRRTGMTTWESSRDYYKYNHRRGVTGVAT
jgi:hypothetical protein